MFSKQTWLWLPHWKSCSRSVLPVGLYSELVSPGGLVYLLVYTNALRLNRFPFRSNHVIWDSLLTLKKRFLEDKFNRLPGLPSLVRCGFHPVV